MTRFNDMGEILKGKKSAYECNKTIHDVVGSVVQAKELIFKGYKYQSRNTLGNSRIRWQSFQNVQFSGQLLVAVSL